MKTENVNLNLLMEHSTRIGLDSNLVQLYGGNTSFKNGSRMWVKGSGFALSQALSGPIFSEIVIDKISPECPSEIEDFQDLCLNDIAPSIETNFHLLIEAPYVTHLHSLGSVSLGISSPSTYLRSLRSDILLIPYARPGLDLAKAIKKVSNLPSQILVLQNLGVIFAGESCEQIEKSIYGFESNVKKYIGSLATNAKFPNWVEILVSGVLTPDEAVFLGKKPFAISEVPLTESVSISTSGEILFPKSFSHGRIELARFYVRVAKLIERKTDISYLPQEEIDFLLGWDKEKNRISMAK